MLLRFRKRNKPHLAAARSKSLSLAFAGFVPFFPVVSAPGFPPTRVLLFHTCHISRKGSYAGNCSKKKKNPLKPFDFQKTASALLIFFFFWLLGKMLILSVLLAASLWLFTHYWHKFTQSYTNTRLVSLEVCPFINLKSELWELHLSLTHLA